MGVSPGTEAPDSGEGSLSHSRRCPQPRSEPERRRRLEATRPTQNSPSQLCSELGTLGTDESV